MTTTLRRASRRKNTADAVGRVVVTVLLQDPKTKRHTVGNIVRSFALESTTVSQVATVLESVFGKEA